jgi:EAL domain-containing protein (putative c-di-GMP-specific phosphodiesterase class I)
MAHALDLDVTAEGVERREQLDVLERLGCDAVQGYFLARPLPAEEIRHEVLVPAR